MGPHGRAALRVIGGRRYVGHQTTWYWGRTAVRLYGLLAAVDTSDTRRHGTGAARPCGSTGYWRPSIRRTPDDMVLGPHGRAALRVIGGRRYVGHQTTWYWGRTAVRLYGLLAAVDTSDTRRHGTRAARPCGSTGYWRPSIRRTPDDMVLGPHGRAALRVIGGRRYVGHQTTWYWGRTAVRLYGLLAAVDTSDTRRHGTGAARPCGSTGYWRPSIRRTPDDMVLGPHDRAALRVIGGRRYVGHQTTWYWGRTAVRLYGLLAAVDTSDTRRHGTGAARRCGSTGYWRPSIRRTPDDMVLGPHGRAALRVIGGRRYVGHQTTWYWGRTAVRLYGLLAAVDTSDTRRHGTGAARPCGSTGYWRLSIRRTPDDMVLGPHGRAALRVIGGRRYVGHQTTWYWGRTAVRLYGLLAAVDTSDTRRHGTGAARPCGSTGYWRPSIRRTPDDMVLGPHGGAALRVIGGCRYVGHQTTWYWGRTAVRLYGLLAA
ncbi:MAG: hypothetical protein KatS3mg055_2340 [Chloroflexus sp.]|nr:MAG: hypothetical protein KatS3mg055_2340 [Chloroflexus sp.]